jgi:hypothetical protein
MVVSLHHILVLTAQQTEAVAVAALVHHTVK